MSAIIDPLPFHINFRTSISISTDTKKKKEEGKKKKSKTGELLGLVIETAFLQ